MADLSGRQIVIGISGGIAAYKAAELVRLLRRQGAEVRVVMTEAAQAFISPLTLQALSGLPVHISLLDPAAEGAMGHIELARWAQQILIAPATADVLARLAHGHANDLLTTLCLASEAPLAVAPAMNRIMWNHPATRTNMARLLERGIQVFGPAEGEQACGEVGAGRMLEAQELAELLAGAGSGNSLWGKTFVITAGPTREAIDPVRYISNHSSGKMGFALARAAREQGARVILISGPVNLPTPPGVERIDVLDATSMLAAALDACRDAHVFVATAAVADFRVKQVAPQKIKKTASGALTLELVANPDIVAKIAQEFPGLITVGFAAESEKLVEHARAKLERKQLDLIIANDISGSDIGFGSDFNAVTVISATREVHFSRRPKSELARELVAFIGQHFLHHPEEES